MVALEGPSRSQGLLVIAMSCFIDFPQWASFFTIWPASGVCILDFQVRLASSETVSLFLWEMSTFSQHIFPNFACSRPVFLPLPGPVPFFAVVQQEIFGVKATCCLPSVFDGLKCSIFPWELNSGSTVHAGSNNPYSPNDGTLLLPVGPPVQVPAGVPQLGIHVYIGLSSFSPSIVHRKHTCFELLPSPPGSERPLVIMYKSSTSVPYSDVLVCSCTSLSYLWRSQCITQR